ncbi:GDP-mannose pyrophosphatase NudK [Salmonella enterica subsp. enterica serovar Heidelberg str. 77-1831]|nr:GDP-mannose pyrophosphatase NudK [Salmonella enterica subsp. enterica serovar Heidelberg str. 640151-11]KJT84446.1 GDP-mannose pyrophosphatase NudK [Salmonella enterica subsp. enterica serovar Heidelberg str. 75-3547]KJT88217.1 GDP-mannose pyrophosphatase NudK [Salmonella enterica subsp. enterica serovar Heidelberg str. 76-0300]KJT95516.1 GDP-mannose pyrophosphatase NudK [Salmonella enterica subsp. enterica serovar Heidelberg str. 77-2823]KJT98774.1 GDP-mannose pyrophosphatase NudK [Salmonel
MSQTITLIKDKILSDNYFTLRNITYDLTRRNGEVIRHKREVYDRGNGATILLYNSTKKPCFWFASFAWRHGSTVIKTVC